MGRSAESLAAPLRAASGAQQRRALQVAASNGTGPPLPERACSKCLVTAFRKVQSHVDLKSLFHAKQAEAERDRRAKIIHAEAEFQASQTLVNAAKILSSIPAAMQLRYLQTLTEIGAEQNSTVVFPMPIDIIKPFLELLDTTGKAPSANGAVRVPLMKEVPLGA